RRRTLTIGFHPPHAPRRPPARRPGGRTPRSPPFSGRARVVRKPTVTDHITDTAPDAAAPDDGTVLDGTPEVVVETTERPEPLPQDFAEFGVRQDIVDSLAAEGIVHPFPIQAMTLPVALSGQDIIGQAKTGTGKTLGFGIPVVQRVVGR